MKPESVQHSLLTDVLAENAPADFERALLDDTLRAVRRRRRLRRSSRGLAVAGVLAAIGLTIWNALPPLAPLYLVRPSLRIVNSQALPPSMVIGTKPGSVVVVTSSLATVLVVETGSIQDPFKEINDEQLLALVGGRPAALVRQGPNQAELLFLNPEDTNGFRIQ